MMTHPNAPVADAARGNFADRMLPAPWRPYARLARLDRPIGWWLLMWPCWWSAALVADQRHQALPDLWHLVLLWAGAVVMRGAGCTWNDILDRDIDAKVARTQSRPLPSGQVSLGKAALFLAAEGLAGLLILWQFNRFTIFIGVLSLVVVAVYPAMKRITSYPQIVLGLAFSWGALIGWTATAGRLEAPAVILYLSSVLWVVGYDTIYAHQDLEDDAMVGLGSTALAFGKNARSWLAGLYAATTIGIGIALIAAGAGLAAYAGLMLFAAHLGRQVARFRRDDPALALQLFNSSNTAGWIFFLGLVADGLIRHFAG